MRRASWLAVAAVVLACGLALAQTPAVPQLEPLPRCEVERLALQDQVVQLRAQVVSLQTQLDRQAIEAERARVTPTADGYQWDWPSLRFVPVPAKEPAK